MKKIVALIGILISVSTLVSCQTQEPTVFGIPQSQFNQLTKAQQDQVIKGYNERKATEAANAPLISAIDKAGEVLKHQQYHNRSSTPPQPNIPNVKPPWPTDESFNKSID